MCIKKNLLHNKLVLVYKKNGASWRPFRLASCYLCHNSAAGISLLESRSSRRDAPGCTYSSLWLISRKSKGAVRSHSLSGEHMSGPICHWLLWEWHQRWPLDLPHWRRNASKIVFHYRGERARTDMRKWENRKTGKKAFRPVLDLSCFSFLLKAFMKWAFDSWTKLLSSPPCDIQAPTVHKGLLLRIKQGSSHGHTELPFICCEFVPLLYLMIWTFLSPRLHMDQPWTLFVLEFELRDKLLLVSFQHASQQVGHQSFIKIWAEINWTLMFCFYLKGHWIPGIFLNKNIRDLYLDNKTLINP